MRSSLIVLLLAGIASGQESITIRNTMLEPIKLYIHYEDMSYSGPHYMARGDAAAISLDRKGKYHITIRDQLKRDLMLGWIDLHSRAKHEPEVALLPLYQSRGRLLGFDINDEPVWRPIGKPYAMRVMLVGDDGGRVPYSQEYIFVNDDSLRFVDVYYHGAPSNFRLGDRNPWSSYRIYEVR